MVKKNWASSMKVYLNYLNSHLGFRPSITDKHFLQYYQDIAANLYKSEWREQVNHIRDNSESGGRLNIYSTPFTRTAYPGIIIRIKSRFDPGLCSHTYTAINV